MKQLAVVAGQRRSSERETRVSICDQPGTGGKEHDPLVATSVIREPKASGRARLPVATNAIGHSHPHRVGGWAVQSARRVLAVRMMRSAVRWLTFHCVASSADEGWAPRRSCART